ncbi:hypothetical protein ACIA5D_36460 [Actinoplanes sp. NPDC051513]|uniref:hypothetical protein n=1 Tax=Actinoplanes sp. NPDC051513 TaxID=3363908 RepID=UPI0037AE2EFA
MEFLVCCVLAYWVVKHIPQLAGEAAQEWRYAQQGEESPAAKARRDRLVDAGIDPATGGAFRQYWGNAWRDFWLDLDEDRQKCRARTEAAAVTDGRGWWTRLGEKVGRRLDEMVDGQAAKWRHRNPGGTAADGSPPDPPDPAGSTWPDTDDAGPDRPPHGDGPGNPHPDPAASDPVQVPSTLGDPAPSGPPKEDPISDLPPIAIGPAEAEALKHELFGNCSQDPTRCPHCAAEQRQRPDTPAQPVKVSATVGAPAADTHTPAGAGMALPAAPTERNPAMTQAVTTRGIAVTGVISGAQEAEAIRRQLEAATAAYLAAIRSARGRINSLGEQTLSIVQFAGASAVVTRMAQAAEAAAAAERAASSCAAEVGPLLQATRREFDKRNS